MKITFPTLRNQFLFSLSVMLFWFVLSSCNPANTTETSGQDVGPLAKITFQLGWLHEYSSAGVYAAEKNGHFAEQGLEVNLLEGGFNDAGFIDPIAQVLEGKAEFGVADSTALILARAEGKPVVAIATILQRSPFAIISLVESNLLRPQDLVGKTVAVADGSTRAVFETFLLSQSIDPASVNTISRISFGIDPLTNHEVDAFGGWVINEGVQLRESGFEPNFILPSDYGINTYDTVIFTTETTLTEKPEIVEKFLRAVIQGWNDAAANLTEAINFTLEYNSTLVLDEQKNRLSASLPLIKPAGSSIGLMDPEVWSDTHDILIAQGILESAIDINAVYTNLYLEKIYSK